MLDIVFQFPFGIRATPQFLIGTILEILISGFIFRISLKAVGAHITLKRALTFSVIIRLITLITSLLVPPIFYGLYPVILTGLIWLLLVMNVFKLTFAKAIFVAVIQAIIIFAFVFFGISYFIKTIKG